MADEVKIFRIKGKFQMGNVMQPFTKEIRALKKEHAIEIVMSDLGSKHKVKRRKIKIDEVKEISKEEVQDQFLKSFIEIFG